MKISGITRFTGQWSEFSIERDAKTKKVYLSAETQTGYSPEIELTPARIRRLLAELKRIQKKLGGE